MVGPNSQFSTNERWIKGIGLAGNLRAKILAQNLSFSITYKIKGGSSSHKNKFAQMKAGNCNWVDLLCLTSVHDAKVLS